MDSGPGHNNNQLMCDWQHNFGIHLYPDNQNNTSAPQETDQAYEMFKVIFVQQLDEC